MQMERRELSLGLRVRLISKALRLSLNVITAIAHGLSSASTRFTGARGA